MGSDTDGPEPNSTAAPAAGAGIASQGRDGPATARPGPDAGDHGAGGFTPARAEDVASPRPADTGSYPTRAFADTSGDDTDTPTRAPGTDPLPYKVGGSPSSDAPATRPGGPSQTGRYRADQQARPPQQYRSVGGTGGFPPAAPRGPATPPPARVASAAVPDPGDELFAPRVPSRNPVGQLPGDDTQASAFDLGETTPIFEEIASAWFRSNRPVPVSWESDTGSHPTVPQATTASADTDPNGLASSGIPTPPDAWGDARSALATPHDGWPSVGRPIPGPADAVADAESAPPTRPSPHLGQQAPSVGPPSSIPAAMPPGVAGRPSFEPADVPAARSPEPQAADFSTAADEGWLAASDAVADRPEELTAAGLPKRRPRARLIPGSAGSAVLAPAVTAARSAESIRGRLASYQQGVRQGRETRMRGTSSDQPTPPAGPGADHDEES